jgi:TolB-like protein/DNA-binding winged helix-turn-helix (wHTH) protein/Tfp pilus assembly protein PilF
LRILDISIDMASGTVWRGSDVLDLPELSFRLLATLATRAPAMVSKDELIAEVWRDVVVSDETLMQRVRLLRQALDDDSQNPRYVASVRGRGYRMAAPVETVEAPVVRGRSAWHRKLWAAMGLTFIVLIALDVAFQDSASPPAISTLAVLPFSDLSENSSFGFFADGMQEELLARLARLDEISVLSRTSVERFRSTTETIPAIARTLNAGGIIEGSVRVDGNQLRITVQLIEGETDRHLWAETFDGQLTVENVFAIQERVANSIAEALRVEYRRQHSEALVLPTADIEAYNLYLLGRYHTFLQTPENLEMAVDYLGRATERDAEFAEAYATLGWAYSFLGSEYGRHTPASVLPKARQAALRALELNDRLADAHSLYADILAWYDWEFDLAETEYRKTIALDPLNVLGYALFLSTQGRHDEAVELIERRLKASPDDAYVRVNAGWRYYHAGRYDEAIEAARLAGSHPDAATLLGYSHMARGEINRAVAVFEDDLQRRGRGEVQLGNLANALYRAGEPSRARPLLEELEQRADNQFVSPLSLAAIYFAAGDETRGYKMLESAVENRARGVIFLNVSTSFAEQRSDPRFVAIVDRVGLPAHSSRNKKPKTDLQQHSI